jgi:hypothetical protein
MVIKMRESWIELRELAAKVGEPQKERGELGDEEW